MADKTKIELDIADLKSLRMLAESIRVMITTLEARLKTELEGIRGIEQLADRAIRIAESHLEEDDLEK
jgi:hypothetical protein